MRAEIDEMQRQLEANEREAVEQHDEYENQVLRFGTKRGHFGRETLAGFRLHLYLPTTRARAHTHTLFDLLQNQR